MQKKRVSNVFFLFSQHHLFLTKVEQQG